MTARAQALLRQARAHRGWVPCALHAKQRAFLALTQGEAMYGGAAGGGKTEALLADALQYVDRKQYSALILRRTFPALSLRGSIMQRALEWLGRDFWNERDKVFRFPSGATIQFGYCNTTADLDRYKSAQFHRIYIDELTEWPEAWYTFLFSRIRANEGDDIPTVMRSATNPDGVGNEWVRRRFGIPEGQIVKDHIVGDDCVFMPARAEDNPTLNLVAYEGKLKKLGPAKYQQLRWGRWVRDGEGLVYGSFSTDRNVGRIPKDLTGFGLAIDYGFTDRTAFAVLGWRAHDPRVYGVECYKLDASTPSRAAVEARRLDKRYGFEWMVGDTGGLGKGYVEEAISRFRLPIESADKTNKRGYIKLINGDFVGDDERGPLIMVDRERCAELVGEYIILPWHPNLQKEADGFDNHCADAFLYGWRRAYAYLAEPAEEKPAEGSQEAHEAEAERMLEERIAEVQRDASRDWWDQ